MITNAPRPDTRHGSAAVVLVPMMDLRLPLSSSLRPINSTAVRLMKEPESRGETSGSGEGRGMGGVGEAKSERLKEANGNQAGRDTTTVSALKR